MATPYGNSGIFLTPIDFRALPDQSLSRYRRLTIPLAAIKPTEAAVTYEWEATRIVLPLSEETLKEVQNRWTADVVRTWFGRDRHRLFFHVPQVVTYQERIPILMGGVAGKRASNGAVSRWQRQAEVSSGPDATNVLHRLSPTSYPHAEAFQRSTNPCPKIRSRRNPPSWMGPMPARTCDRR